MARRDPENSVTERLRGLVPGGLRRGRASLSSGELPLFLQVLVEEGFPAEQAAAAAAQQRSPLDLEAELLRSVEPGRLLRALAVHFGVDALDLAQVDLSPQVALMLPRTLAESLRVSCVGVDEHGVTLAMVDPADDEAAKEVQAATSFKVVRRFVVLATQLGAFLEELHGGPASLPVSAQEIVDEVLRKAIREKVSDIHFEPLEDDMLVRFRKDGLLVPSYDLGQHAPRKVLIRHLKAAIPTVIKNKSGVSGKTMDIAERQKPQDGRIYLPGSRLDMRVSILPTVHGESVVIRIHSASEEGQADRDSFRQLGFSEHDLERLYSIIQAPYGMLLVSGPTGSGKTTTLYTVLRALHSPEKKIVTVEDPVEYTVPGIMQVQTNPAKGLTFASALRSFLRHDPDIVMVGEIRDQETAEMAVEASLTGHLVLSTIHANDAVRTITRIKDVGISPLLLNSVCLGTLAQRLVRLVCPACREPARFSPRFFELLERHQVPYRRSDLVQGVGCPHCNGTGYQGRTGIYELMVMTPEIREAIASQAPDAEMERLAREQGMRLLLADALAKAAAGQTTEAEVLRVTLADQGAGTAPAGLESSAQRFEGPPMPERPGGTAQEVLNRRLRRLGRDTLGG